MKMLLKVGFRLPGLIVLMLLMYSCVPIKDRIYFQKAEEGSDTTKQVYQIDHTPSYKLRAGNNLYVRIISLDDEATDFFNIGLGRQGALNINDAALYLSSYSVSDSGYMELPFIGEIYVQDLTLEEAKIKIQNKVNEYLTNTMVILKLVNYNVTVVGEVFRPGQFKVYQDQISIFEILAYAEDMTTFAKRDDVILVRKTEKGSEIHHLNLLSEDILESEYFYILPEDIVYVKPVKGKNFAFESFPYTLIISTISLTIALFALFK
jgi:polysaccharide export outer membrane protein